MDYKKVYIISYCYIFDFFFVSFEYWTIALQLVV